MATRRKRHETKPFNADKLLREARRLHRRAEVSDAEYIELVRVIKSAKFSNDLELTDRKSLTFEESKE